MTETSIKNNIESEISDDKRSEMKKDGRKTASYLLSPLSEITNPEHSSLVKLVKYPHSNRAKDC